MAAADFSTLALEDLRGILLHIGESRPSAAERFVELLKAKCDVLAKFPKAGTARNDLSVGLRALSAGSYVIYFRPTQHGVRIERVLHGSRDVDLLFGSDDG